MNDREKAIRQALDAGPTAGTWKVTDEPPNAYWVKGSTIGASDPKDARRICDVAIDGPQSGGYGLVNSAYIAACNPEAITALLAELDAARADAKRLDFMSVKTARFVQFDGAQYRVYQDAAPPEAWHAVWDAMTYEFHSTARAAIDVAIAQQEGKP